ncbi:hypothetical protein REMIM1_PE00195 (plasmid) [Rhizobium etli bv. mimosae str. Mim1]|nr:hypothetical protein REMIM1_PE00195 [Rhizobium etli bv. mimosae str. Mim1]
MQDVLVETRASGYGSRPALDLLQICRPQTVSFDIKSTLLSFQIKNLVFVAVLRLSSCHSQLDIAPVSKPMHSANSALLRISSAGAPGFD